MDAGQIIPFRSRSGRSPDGDQCLGTRHDTGHICTFGVDLHVPGESRGEQGKARYNIPTIMQRFMPGMREMFFVEAPPFDQVTLT